MKDNDFSGANRKFTPQAFVLLTDSGIEPTAKKGATVYKCAKADYGCADLDTRMTGIQHISVSLKPDGDYPFFTHALKDLQKVEAEPCAHSEANKQGCPECGEKFEKPRPIRFADLPAQPQGEPVAIVVEQTHNYGSYLVFGSSIPGVQQPVPVIERKAHLLDQSLPTGTKLYAEQPAPVELLRDALDHIAKTCHQSRQQSRRIRWIEARANGALEGKMYDAKLVELPLEVDREIDRFKRRDARQLVRIRALEGSLRDVVHNYNHGHLKHTHAAIQAADELLTAEPETCTWSSLEFSWSSDCGMLGWEFTDGGTPAENGMKFCHCCGKPIHHEIGD